MNEFEQLLDKVKSTLLNNKELNITPREIENFSSAQLDEIAHVIEEFNVQYINQSLKHHIISPEAADYLKAIYANTRETTKSLSNNISATLLEAYRPQRMRYLADLGEEPGPEIINAIDLNTGELEENDNNASNRNMPRYKEYASLQITPFTNTALTFYDYRDNPIRVIIPHMKDVRRAIDKVKIPVFDSKGNLKSVGGKYYNQYIKEVEQLKNKYHGAELEQRLKAVRLPHERLADVFRLTITRKYYSDTDETIAIFSGDSKYGINSKETKDGFEHNSKQNEKYNKKNYRDKKIFFHLDINGHKMVVECQVKIQKLNEGDFLTHKIYAGEQQSPLEEEKQILISRLNTANYGLRYWEENLKKFTNYGDRLLAEHNINKLNLMIQYVNKKKIRDYNLQVLDKAYRLEDLKYAHGKQPDMQITNIHNGEQVGVFKNVVDFIKQNFIQRPYKAYDLSNAFNVTDDELKSMGFLINAQQMRDFAARYSSVIVEKYRTILSGHDSTMFVPENKEKADIWFREGAYNEQSNTYVEPSVEELETLGELGFAVDEEKNYKILDKHSKKINNKRYQEPPLHFKHWFRSQNYKK